MGFFKEQWMQIRGHLKWDLLKVAGAATLTALYALIARTRHLPADILGYSILFVVSLLLLIWLGRKARGIQRTSNTQGGTVAPATALATPATTFNPEQFFAQAYNSPLAEEVAGNIRTAASNYRAGQEREDFFVRFIATGLIGYLYDTGWWMIYGSQLVLLQELNRRALSIEEAKTYYDMAAQQYKAEYANYTFDQSLAWLRSQVFITQQGNMIGITVRGKDFLKYLIHWGRSSEDKRL